MSAQYQKNENTLKAIDGALDALVDTTGQIHQNSVAIGNELKDQIQTANEINNHMDKTNDKINKATDKLVAIQSKGKGSCVAWILMVLFFLLGVAGFVVAFI